MAQMCDSKWWHLLWLGSSKLLTCKWFIIINIIIIVYEIVQQVYKVHYKQWENKQKNSKQTETNLEHKELTCTQYIEATHHSSSRDKCIQPDANTNLYCPILCGHCFMHWSQVGPSPRSNRSILFSFVAIFHRCKTFLDTWKNGNVPRAPIFGYRSREANYRQ